MVDGRYPLRNYLCEIWWRSVKGFRGGEGSDIASSPLTLISSLQHSRTTVRVHAWCLCCTSVDWSFLWLESTGCIDVRLLTMAIVNGVIYLNMYCCCQITYLTVLLITASPAKAVAKYCSERVCVSVCLSASISPKPHARFLPFFVHIAYRRGSVLLRRGDKIPRGRGNFGVFFPLTVHCTA